MNKQETYQDLEGYPERKYIIPDLITGEAIEVSYEVWLAYCEIMDSLKDYNNGE